MPLVHLIALIINAHFRTRQHGSNAGLFRAASAWSLIRKTSLQDRTDNPLRSSKELTKHFRADLLAENNTIMPGVRNARGLMYVLHRQAQMSKPMRWYDHDRHSERPSLHDVRYHATEQFLRAFSSRKSIVLRTRICLFGRVFPEQPAVAMLWRAAFVSTGLPAEAAEQRRLVEPDGIEPTTSCLQSRRSPS